MNNQYRKKPVTVMAAQFDGTRESYEALPFHTDTKFRAHYREVMDRPTEGQISMITESGDANASPGDWIIRGTKGEYYPCKPDIFAEIYERLS